MIYFIKIHDTLNVSYYINSTSKIIFFRKLFREKTSKKHLNLSIWGTMNFIFHNVFWLFSPLWMTLKSCRRRSLAARTILFLFAFLYLSTRQAFWHFRSCMYLYLLHICKCIYLCNFTLGIQQHKKYVLSFFFCTLVQYLKKNPEKIFNFIVF